MKIIIENSVLGIPATMKSFLTVLIISRIFVVDKDRFVMDTYNDYMYCNINTSGFQKIMFIL